MADRFDRVDGLIPPVKSEGIPSLGELKLSSPILSYVVSKIDPKPGRRSAAGCFAGVNNVLSD